MVLRIFAVIGIISIIIFLRIAEYKAYNFDYTQIPCGIISLCKFIFYVYRFYCVLAYFDCI